MKLPSTSVLRAFALTLLLLAGCGRAARPASSLSEKDRAMLDAYEPIRAALAVDDLKGSKRAGAALLAVLQPTPASPTALVPEAKEIMDSTGLDQSRKAFATLSTEAAKLADGVTGYYVLESPMQKGAAWVQRSAAVDNPYAGKATHDIGALRK